MSVYSVKKLNKDIAVKVPGSKSITNRALLIAALADGDSVIRGALESDDSRHFLECLKTLGFDCKKDGNDIHINGLGGIIPKKEAEIYVGSAGTAARFLTAMLAFSDGEYTVRSSEQMARRPMRELIVSLMAMGSEFEFIGESYSLPFRVRGIYFAGLNNAGNCDAGAEDIGNIRDAGDDSNVRGTGGVRGQGDVRDTDDVREDADAHEDYVVSVNIDKSSQYLSALLMTAPMLKRNLRINIEGNRKAKSYVAITVRMMREFGVPVENVENTDGSGYLVEKAVYSARGYDVEPDMSAACYFYAMAAANGVSAVVEGVHGDIMQGDKKFLEVLRDMGCEVKETPGGIMVTGTGRLSGIDVDMSDFSDQTMTLAALAPFADGEVNIRNVGHIRNQESDRLAAIDTALKKMGVETAVREDGILIRSSKPSAADIDTFNDHRMAMAFAVTGTVYGNIRICNPNCCEKTFPEFFDILDSITGMEGYDEKDN